MALMYYKEPEDVAGTIFLAVTPEEGDSRMWLYLPALGAVKELVAEEQEQSFAGSTFSYKDIGSQSSTQDDYDAELVGEEAVTVDGESYDCYVLTLTAKPDADVDYPTQKLWVSKDFWTSLKGESYDEDGRLAITMEVVRLGEFEGNVIPDEMFSKNVIDGNSTRIIFLERKESWLIRSLIRRTSRRSIRPTTVSEIPRPFNHRPPGPRPALGASSPKNRPIMPASTVLFPAGLRPALGAEVIRGDAYSTVCPSCPITIALRLPLRRLMAAFWQAALVCRRPNLA